MVKNNVQLRIPHAVAIQFNRPAECIDATEEGIHDSTCTGEGFIRYINRKNTFVGIVVLLQRDSWTPDFTLSPLPLLGSFEFLLELSDPGMRLAEIVRNAKVRAVLSDEVACRFGI